MKTIPDGNTRALFEGLVAGKPFGQQTLLDLEPQLLEYGIALTPPNAAGDRTKIGDPISRRWTRVGFGEGRWVWTPQPDAAYEPPASIPPAGDHVPLLARVAALQARIEELEKRLAGSLSAVTSQADNAVRIGVACRAVTDDNTARLKALEARPVPTGCEINVFGMRLRGRLT